MPSPENFSGSPEDTGATQATGWEGVAEMADQFDNNTNAEQEETKYVSDLPFDEQTRILHERVMQKNSEPVEHSPKKELKVHINGDISYETPARDLDAEQAVKRDLGIIGGYTEPYEKVHHVNTREQAEAHNRLSHEGVDWMENAQEVIADLPDEAVDDLVGHRFRNTANTLETTNTNDTDRLDRLGRSIKFDLDLLNMALSSDKKLSNINVSNRMGIDDYRDIQGLLDAYQDKIQEFGADIPLIDAKTDAPVVDQETQKQVTALGAIENIRQSLQPTQEQAA